MKKEIEVQEKLWGKLCRDSLEKRVRSAKEGHLPNGLTLAELSGNETGFRIILGDFAPRVLVVSNPGNPLTLVPEQIAIAGGWCALRTRDIANLSEEGVIMDPKTGQLDQVQSVQQVADWIEQSVAFDQIIECIGTVNGGEYIAISEGKLWTERITAKLSNLFRRNLSSKEIEIIRRAIEKAERSRGEMTERYLRWVTGEQSLKLKRVTDEELWEELQRARNEVFKRAGLSMEDLGRMFPNETPIIQSSAIVWTMYSEPYFDALRRSGAISRQLAFIVEPSLHTYADNKAGNRVVQTIYQSRGIYLDPKGINPNTGFIAFIECVTETGINVRKNLGVGHVPNISNWENLLDNGILDPEQNLTIDPRSNRLFVWGVNVFPFGETQRSLLRLVGLQEEFLEEKQKLNSMVSNSAKRDPDVRSSLQEKTEDLRQTFLAEVRNENEKVACTLKTLFRTLTENLI